MADIVDRATRSRMMAGIRGKDTKPELQVRRFLHRLGLRYRLHVRELPGRPDVVLPKYKSVVLIHGCFWHQHSGCKYAAKPSSNARFWAQKLAQNIERDRKAEAALRQSGWNVFVVWECQA